MSNKTERFSVKVSVVYVNVHVSKRLKEELAWAIDKWLWAISNKMLLKTVIPLRIYRINHFKSSTILYALLCDP